LLLPEQLTTGADSLKAEERRARSDSANSQNLNWVQTARIGCEDATPQASERDQQTSASEPILTLPRRVGIVETYHDAGRKSTGLTIADADRLKFLKPKYGGEGSRPSYD